MFVSIEKSVLYVVATPIGNRGDISSRAVEVLRGVDLIAAEDTRHSRSLLQYLGIDTPMLALHDHNERQLTGQLVARLLGGESLALISDAGTPLISDPGFPLVRECHAGGVRVTPVPGASALICALSASGLPTDKFVFEGFPPRTQSARREQFGTLNSELRTMVFYESSHRVLDCCRDLAEVLGAQRPAVMARELTKRYETLFHSDLGAICQLLETEPVQRKGEFVILVAGAPKDARQLSAETERVLRVLVDELPLKQAASLAARLTGEKKNALYRQALSWRSEE
ncbi:MAG: 16S rRNA (cytidine(1402)-2'-O)-methyltransferase [Gammaproteobacteria bacterium]|nr:16S rRNA (cytidine(1402)-2'-O)-methyltransferase [Gammaproteobacteria bacterium]